MSEPVSALNGASYEGFATVRDAGTFGMVTLRVLPDTAGLDEAIREATGCTRPERRRITTAGACSVLWMSPDEYLFIVPRDDAARVVATLNARLAGRHHLAVDVSGARAVFRIEGTRADQVLRKLSPADIDAMAPDEVRRTRLAQVAAAFWAADEGYTLIVFRSVAGYVMNLLSMAARPGGELS